MSAEIQEHLPPFHNLIKEVIQLANNVLCSCPHNSQTSFQHFHFLPHPILPLQTPPSQLFHGASGPPELVQQHPSTARHLVDLGANKLVQTGSRDHER